MLLKAGANPSRSSHHGLYSHPEFDDRFGPGPSDVGRRQQVLPAGGRAVYSAGVREAVRSPDKPLVKPSGRMNELVNKYKL